MSEPTVRFEETPRPTGARLVGRWIGTLWRWKIWLIVTLAAVVLLGGFAVRALKAAGDAAYKRAIYDCGKEARHEADRDHPPVDSRLVLPEIQSKFWAVSLHRNFIVCMDARGYDWKSDNLDQSLRELNEAVERLLERLLQKERLRGR